MAQMFNILQASIAVMFPMSLAGLMESYTSVVRIEALMLLGRSLILNKACDSSKSVCYI